MKFDVIIGNPPYQMDDGGYAASAIPLYHKFVEKALEMKPRYVSMIIPSRWMKGGRGLTNFRNKFMADKRISHIYDYQNPADCFDSVRISGGVCYFLWDESHDNELEYHYTDLKGHYSVSQRYLKTDFYDKVIRDIRQLPIISKVLSKTDNRFSEIVAKGGSFGFGTFLFNQPERYPEVSFSDNPKEGYSLVYGVSGAGGSTRTAKYVNDSSITNNKASVSKYKLFFPTTYDEIATIPPKIIKGLPGTLSTSTFIKIGDFNTEEEMNNCLSYIKTKFFRALLLYNRHSISISKPSFDLIPLQDFSKSWTDEELYKKYKLTQEEIDYIEENIEPMD